ncbi:MULTISPECIES: anti-repressor SinI family protein [Bacillus]|nr:anti-repressor SinI family protein [Bacillus pumilus]AMM99105.1 antirepressor [Bacillus pumilus]KRU17626.1 antirepressor [Bacillus pumilus]MCY7678768.1 anti-repressor SinI family protein [Bacillus pumilus]MCY9672462.1 anti-repressor SinI family protein [Bacillus pumilus]MDH3149575.1 anti-repressor SinI family protein [Bacillus pumilus]
MDTQVKRRVDEEWVYLIQEAKKMGLAIEEIQAFLTSNGDQKMINKP